MTSNVLEADEETGKLIQRTIQTPRSAMMAESLKKQKSTLRGGLLPSLRPKNPKFKEGHEHHIPDTKIDFEFEELGLELKSNGFKVRRRGTN